MPVTVGVLIIGSLYWRNEGRERWRDCRLQRDRKWFVNAPIRYGHWSSNGTYTMAFGDPAVTPLGQAIVLQCQGPVESGANLIEEAEWLWSAEQNNVPPDCKSTPGHRLSPDRKWGCVALLSNPHKEIPQEMLDRWAKRVAAESNYNSNPRRLVDGRGVLQIPWPDLVEGGPTPVDLLLATSNDPERTYPTVEAIANAWNHHPDVDYFQKNRQNGIYTFQDEEIGRLLQ